MSNFSSVLAKNVLFWYNLYKIRGKMWTLHVMAGGSSNNKIATVTSTGKITAKKAGTCKIYVKGNGITKVVTVTVKK